MIEAVQYIDSLHILRLDKYPSQSQEEPHSKATWTGRQILAAKLKCNDSKNLLKIPERASRGAGDKNQRYR